MTEKEEKNKGKKNDNKTYYDASGQSISLDQSGFDITWHFWRNEPNEHQRNLKYRMSKVPSNT